MQETFGPQFIDRYMKPLLQRIVTDMAEPKPETQYLQRIMIGGESAKLKELEREHFFNEYFRKDKTKPFSTTEEGDVKFQNKFLDEFTGFFQMRRKLSGIEGLRRALLPDKDKNFNQEVSRNIFQMAYKMCIDFEKERIQEILKKEKGEVSAKDQEDLDAGRLKLIIVNGVEHVIHEEEAKNAASDPNMQGVVVTEYLSKQVEGSDATSSTAGAPNGGLESAPVPLATVAGDFGDSKIASTETLLESSGLELVGGLSYDTADKEKRFLKGKVRDVNGQMLDVRIDTKSDKNDPHKFAFTFDGPPPADVGGKDRTGETFFLSQDDLKKFEPKPGQRQSAEDIAHPKVGDMAKEKKSPIPGAGLPKPAIGGKTIEAVGITKTTVSPPPPLIGLKGKAKEKFKIPEGVKVPNMPALMVSGGEGGNEAAVPGGPVAIEGQPGLPAGVKPLPIGSVAAKKQAAAAKKQAPGSAPVPPGGSFTPGGGYAGAVAAPQPKPQGGGWKTTAAIAGAHVAGLGAAVGGAVANHNAAVNNPENLAGATSFVVHLIHCIGLICRS